MVWKILVLPAVALAAAAVAGGAFARHAATPTLVGTDGPGFTITLEMNGKTVKALKAGTYKVVIHDKASIHGFSLDGPHGFAKDISPVAFTGTKTVTLELKAGSYKFYCPAHESTMFGHFKAT
jgi:plastocyanin